jgi:hypothetical protein
MGREEQLVLVSMQKRSVDAMFRPRLVHHFVFALLLCACSGGGDGRESFGDKQESSILQGVEFKTRNSPLISPEFLTVENYELMAVPSLANGSRIWIMLRPQSPPFYKQLPAGNYTVAKELVRELARSHRISSTVEEVLRSHVVQE